MDHKFRLTKGPAQRFRCSAAAFSAACDVGASRSAAAYGIGNRSVANAALLSFALIAGLSLVANSPRANPSEKIHLVPKFATGQSFRYQIETRTTTTGNTTTPVVNPEAASKLKQISDMQIRLDVLDAQPPAVNGTPGAVRLRVAYEKASATSESDAYDPAAAALQDQYNRLQGRSMEFTIEPNGEVSKVTGLDDVLLNPSAAGTIRTWINSLSASAKLPREGIAVGQKWTSERPLDGAPLSGLVTRTESNYLRDEPCRTPDNSSDKASSNGSDGSSGNSSAGPADKPPDKVKQSATHQPSNKDDQLCAVILTHFEILHHGPNSPDATPEEYRHNGLRTSGTWTGSGESLDAISLQTGMITRSTQTGTQSMDFEIVSALSGSKMHYIGQVETQSEITLLPPNPPASPTQ
ncbi:MAG: hypothetical protein WB630_02575 [Candidatus Acidiferrales bacterium]